MAILEDPHDRAERRGDREQVHDDGLERQDHRPEEEEQHEHRRGHDVRERGGGVASDEVDGVEIDRRESGDRERGVRRRGERADRADQLPGLVAVNALLRDDVEHHDVLADRGADESLELRGQLRTRL